MKPVLIYLLLPVAMTTHICVDIPNPFEGTYDLLKKWWDKESCDSTWISFKAEGLKFDLENKLFGQHIAADVILKTVSGFMSNNNPQKPLVLSLHGPTGTGKNFAARLIAENIFSQGMDSKYVHVFTPEHHFPHPSKIETYKAQLWLQFKHSASKCERSMFIFDEMDKMHPGLIDTIKPYLEHYNNLDGVSYRKAIFIFLSNAGADSITQTTLDFWKEGRDRKEIKLQDLELNLSVSAFNENSGLKYSNLINKHLVDFFIPFLPLEYRHVVQCVLAEMKAGGIQPDVNVAEKMAKDFFKYIPKSKSVFSSQGCKMMVVMTTSVLVRTFGSFKGMFESCDSTWISFKAEDLKHDLENKLFGQHIAANIILKTVSGFMSNNNPQKPLVLSLHGPTGTGKNFAARLIAENIFSQGMDSKYVHVFTPEHHFRHPSKIETYKAQLRLQFKHSASKCERSMFIFDEMDKMHPGLIDTIKPYLEHYNNLDGVSYRKAIFIFLSNAGAESITQTTLDFWKEGRDRKEIKLQDLELNLSVSAFNENSGLKYSNLINKNLVDFFIPFLPLEYRHVVQCVLAEMKAGGIQPDVNVAEKMAKDFFKYIPKSESVFSSQGCKMMVVLTTSVLVHTFGSFKGMFESCDSTWISFKAEGLKHDLENRLFGQHIAADVVLKTVSGFMSNNNPKKPLVLSLHGRTGTGKNFAAKLIAENIYSQGMDSKFVHLFKAEHHFPHQSKIETYKAQLHQQIKHSVSNCERSMFIFDQMDVMHPGLIETIKPYLEHYNKLDGVSYRKAIFIFLSNTGAHSITQTTLDFWKDGRDRTEIKLRDLELSLSVSAFNENSGLKHTSLINKHLVDYFVPFLPLEHSHVVQCVLAEMKARGLQPDRKVAEKVAKDLVYIPKPERIFSSRGCKTIESRLYYV